MKPYSGAKGRGVRKCSRKIWERETRLEIKAAKRGKIRNPIGSKRSF